MTKRQRFIITRLMSAANLATALYCAYAGNTLASVFVLISQLFVAWLDRRGRSAYA